MARLIIKKTGYSFKKIPLAEVYVTPIGLYVEQSSSMSVRHVWGIYRTLEDATNQTDLLETKDLSWSGDAANLPEVFPALYEPIVGAMLQVGQATKDVPVDGKPENNVSWFDKAEVVVK